MEKCVDGKRSLAEFRVGDTVFAKLQPYQQHFTAEFLMEDDSVSQHSINHVSQPDNELSFLDTDRWLDIDNFEDVERMMLNYTPLLPASFGSRSEHDGYPSSSFKESSYAYNRESSQGHPLEATALKINYKEENQYFYNDAEPMSRGFKCGNMQNPMQFRSPGSAKKVGSQFENVKEGHSKVGILPTVNKWDEAPTLGRS
ncbi:hypothetical protein KIW84_024283 [Lathyrus oleraceus]|uniref:Uncharacterized protein n=1 Tax=Pisum sativum TaxID=3888 RepID=A0A9D4YHM1_PEA|nr:hypothetical protein KIW84_024283 [Pisum sativum]